MKTIGEYRARYPQLRELTDYQLTRAVYDTTAPDMPLEDFAKAFGGVTEEDPEEVRIQEYNLSHPDDTIRREDMGKASLLSDTGHGIAAGINELAAIPFWLAEEMGIESAGKAKDYFLKSAEEKRKGYSPEMKLARAEEFFTEEPDGSYGFGGAWTSPRKILGSVAESAPGMVGGMGLSALAARGLMKAGFSRGLAWAVGSSLGEGTIGGAQNALDVHEAILAMPEDKLAASPEYQEILQRTGDPKRAREELANSVAAMTGLKTGASTAVLSAPSGYMFGKILGGETGKTLLGTAAKQGAAEFGEEAGQSDAEQYLSQAELQRADPTIDPMSGVGEAAVSGGFAGMAMGGGMGGFGHVLGGRAQQQPGAPAVSDAQPVLPPEQQAALPEGGHGSPLELGPGQNIVMGTDRAYEDPIATPPPTSPLQKGMEAILGGPLGLSTAPAAPDFAVTPGGRAVSANGIVQPDAFGPIAAGMRSDMPPLLADQVYDVEYSVVPGAPKALSEAPRGLPLGQDKSLVAPESPQPFDAQANGGSAPLQLTRINDKSFMLHGDTAPFEAAIKAAGGRLDRNVGGWRFPLVREGEIRELFGIPLGAETVPGDNLVSEVPEASPEVLRETPLPVSGDMAMSGQTGLEVIHGGLQQGTPGTGTGELLSESVPVDAAGNPGELAAAARGSGRYHGDLGNRPDLDTALPGVDGREAGLGAAVQRTAGSVEVPGEGRGQNVSFNQIPTIPDSGRSASGRGDEPAFRGLPEVGRDVSGGSKGTKNASFEKNGRKGIERKLLRAIERQQGGVSPEAEAWAHGLNPQERKKAYEQLVLNEFKRHTASELGVDEESLRFIPVRKDSETSLRLKEIGGVFGQDVVIFKDSSSVQTGIRGASVPTIEHVVFMEGSAEREKPYLFVLGHELLHRMRSEDLKAYKQFQEYLLDDLQEDAIPRYRENLDRRTGGDGTVARMSDEAILEEIGADLVGKRLTEESFWAKMAEERPSLFARVSQFVRDLLDRVTAAFRADPLPAAWVKDFDAIRRHIDAMMGQWAEKNARAKTGGTPPHSGNTREVFDGRDETVRNAGRNGGEGSDHAGGLLQSNRRRHGAPVDLVGDGGRGGDGGRAAQPAPEGREGERPRQPVAVKIPNRADEPAHYELLEADDVRASHLPSRGFQKNPAYGLENERRYHDEPGSRAKVMENAAKLDPAFLMESVDANHGAPVIDHDNNVLGGNGRAMSIARAYESFPERGEQYREALKANADRLGIDPAQVDAMHSPMLVRRLERGMSREERQQLVTAMNDDFKDAKEKRASGKSRGERFGRRTLDMLSAGLKDAESLREYFDTPASAVVVERMMEDGVIQRSERNAYVGADGLLNPDGKKVVEEALRGRIARSYEALAKLPADVVGKLDAVIPHILVAEGIGKPWNITEHVRDSVDLLVGFKGSGVKEPDTYLKQVNMLTGRAPVQDFSKQAIALFCMALDAKKGEYVKAFESYLKNAKLSPEAGNIPGVAKPQDKAFRDAFGIKTEATPNKPEKAEDGKPEAKEQAVPEVRESRTTRKQDASPVQMSDVYQEGGIEDLLPGKILLNYHGKRTSPVPVGKKNISSWLRKEAEKAVAADSEMLAAVRNGNKNGDGFYMGIIAGEHLQEDFRETFELAEMQNSLASLSRWPERRPDNTQVQVVEVEPGIVPEFKKARDLAKWLKEYFSDKREETILSTGKKVRFGNSNLEASIKRARENTHNQAYAGLNELVRRAEFDSFEAKDARHPNLGGQEVYYSALRIGDTLYAVKFKMDIPSEAELAVRRDWRGEKDIEDLRYKDHALREIEIAPVLYRGVVPNNGVPTQATEAIRRINLGVLRDAVKPSRLENGVLSSVKPGEFLNDAPSSGPRILKSAAQSVADALGKRAANAADTRGVQSFEELPEHIRQLYGDVASRLEGVYDPASGTVYLVADNLHSTARAADVWMHENMVHHGLNGLLGMDEKRRVLNRLWQGMGGMGNAEIASVANKYGVDPLWDVKDRALVMEEYLARLAEKRAAGKLSDQEQTLWRRFVEAVLRAWHALVDAVTGRTGSMKYENVDRLLSALDRYVFEGRPEGMAEGGMVPAMASVDRSGSDMEAAHAAWAQVQRDAEEWGRQVDAFHPHEGTGGRQPRLMAVCRTPDVLQKLGAPDLPMTMTADNLGKVLSDKVDHGLPKELVKQLPQALAEPIMVFESASQADSFVVLTELKHEGRSVMAAVHLDTEKQRVRVNDIASAYKRSNETWYARQIEEGRLLYQDKKKSLAWARTNRLQLPRVRKLPSRLSGKRVLTEEDIVKPIAPDNKPLASLRDIKDVRDITGMSAEDAMNLAKNDPWIGSIFGKSDDVTLMQRIFMLPHWVAKRFPGFKAVYDRQVRRQDERAAERARSLQEIPSLFGENKLSGKDMGELKKLVWDNDGKQIAELEGIDKFLTDEELESGRTTIKANPEWYEGYDKWLSRQPGSDAVKKAMREIRVSLDNDLMRAHNRLARMSEMGDVAIQEFRTQIGHIHNYFPHHRYGDYFIQGKDKKGEVVYREHFDALHRRYARRHFENRLEALKKEYPDTVFDLDENTKLPDEAFGRVLDPEAMEQVIKAALSKVSDKEQADRIAEVLHESVADVMKSSGWGSHAIGRKNIPGFEKDDLFRVLYDYKSGLTGWLTKMESSKDFAEALGKINAKAHPQEWSYTSQYVKDMLRNGDRVDRTVGTIKSAAFAWYLGGNIKTAVLNLTQNVIVGVPRLQMDVEGGARAYIDGAQKQIVNQYARRFTGDKGKGLSEEEARLIQDLYGDALITDAYMEEVRGQVTGGPSTRLWNKLMKVMGYPMSVAERFNRGSLALAAFRAARDGKMKAAARKRYGVEGEKATYEQAKAFAEEIVRDSHFVYGKTNAPELLRSSTAGRGLGAAFTFKTFTANLLGLWSWALRTQGKEGAIMVAKGLGATAALGGLVSLPFYATLMALFQAATGDDDDWTEAIRKQLPQNTMLRDIVCYGLPAGAGVNLGGSLKMELALTGGMQKGGTPKEVLTEGIGDIIGIPWDMFVERPSKVMEAMRADNYWRAVEEVVPTAVSNGMKAWRLATEGQKTLKGRDINDPGERGARRLSSGEALGKLLGFQPVSATRSYDAYAASRHSDSVRADKADEVATIMVKALDAGDSAEMVRARKVLKDWNAKMEKEGKPHMRILMKDVQKRVTQRRRQARLTPKARQKGEAFQSVWG